MSKTNYLRHRKNSEQEKEKGSNKGDVHLSTYIRTLHSNERTNTATLIGRWTLMQVS